MYSLFFLIYWALKTSFEFYISISRSTPPVTLLFMMQEFEAWDALDVLCESLQQ